MLEQKGCWYEGSSIMLSETKESKRVVGAGSVRCLRRDKLLDSADHAHDAFQYARRVSGLNE